VNHEENKMVPIPKKKLFGYFILAYLGAAIILAMVILPVEYGIDPLGIGKLPGLYNLTKKNSSNTVSSNGAMLEAGRAYTQAEPFKSETIMIELEDLGQLEYKLIMHEDATIVYSWKVLGKTPNNGVYFDFHDQPDKINRDQFPDEFVKSYGRGEYVSQRGGFVASFHGYHGWFFMNLEERPITIQIDVSGYYNGHIELYRSVNGEVKNMVDY